MTTTLSTKGQVIIPKEIRLRHGWGEGTELEIEDRGDSIVIRARAEVERTTLDDVLGCLHFEGPAKSVAQMNDALIRLARGYRSSRKS